MSKNHVDVVIVGAGLSGIGAACHLEQHCPNKTYSILESREAMAQSHLFVLVLNTSELTFFHSSLPCRRVGASSLWHLLI